MHHLGTRANRRLVQCAAHHHSSLLHNRRPHHTIPNRRTILDTHMRPNRTASNLHALSNVHRRMNGRILIRMKPMILLLQYLRCGIQPGRQRPAIEPLIHRGNLKQLAILNQPVERIRQLILPPVPRDIIINEILNLLHQLASLLKIVHSNNRQVRDRLARLLHKPFNHIPLVHRHPKPRRILHLLQPDHTVGPLHRNRLGRIEQRIGKHNNHLALQ